MERYLRGVIFGLANLGSRLFGIMAGTIKTLGAGILVIRAFVALFYLSTFAICLLYVMDPTLLTF